MAKFSRGFGEWLKIIQVVLLITVLPTLVFYLIALKAAFVLDVIYHAVVSAMLFQASINFIYALTVIRRKRYKVAPEAKNKPVPKTSFIISAYLPNEIGVIKETILNILHNVQRPKAGIEVIVAYNTPSMEKMELDFRKLASEYPELILANAYYSKSKSNNLNYALEHVSGEMIVLLDADHIVQPDCLSRAWRWLDSGYDVVQGRCRIANGAKNLITGIVEVEFEVIYGILHSAKSIIFDSTIFGGSNGYWKAEVLKAVKFDEAKLTEDIDSTLRVLLKGHRIVHDRSIVSQETAPVSLKRLWYQRKRWAQGWLQCALKYQFPVLKSRHFRLSQKFLWSMLLGWREAYDLVASMLMPVVFAFWLYGGKILLPLNGFIIFALIFTLLSGPFDTIAAYKNASAPRGTVSRYLRYGFFVLIYTMFKTTVHLVAMRDEIAGERKWIISKREK